MGPSDPAGRPPRLGENSRAALWMLASALTTTVQSVIVKDVSLRLDPLEITFFRGVFGLAAILPLLLWPGTGLAASLRTRHPWMLGLRALAGVASLGCGFYALAHLSLASATAINFTTPLFMALLAVLLLGETVGWRRGLALAAGFLGVLVVLRPGAETFHPASLVALAGAFASGLVGVVVKRLARTESMAVILLSFALATILVFALPAWLVWTRPSLADLGWMLGLSLLGVSSQLCFVRACGLGELAVIAPFDYSRLIFAGLLGFWLFAEVPTWSTLLGAAIIVAAMLFIFYRERRLRALAAERPAAPE